ncbi:hypothetical protein Q669_21470 [Labrenzia sp. C1B10]|uniref:hypothetical protein n=1 Tax=unclassified Labrenzia TaxID=2648686 RepID=UPI0003B9042B|nr:MULTISPECIES: hypothetical protein [unclassified Labrenzia]ERP97778.1 hypothetical protein Q669_21470 [Labrenzia sp. C1B10]ERS01570.1 hypothetical protein Q675_05585 [Labrenzia sp. C1B70]
MDEEYPKRKNKIATGAGELPATEPSARDHGSTVTEPEADKGDLSVDSPNPPASPGHDIERIRTSVLRDPIDGGIARAMREFNISQGMARNLDLIRGPLDDLISGQYHQSGVARAVAEAQKTVEAAGGFSALLDRMTRASAGLKAISGVEKLMQQQREMERKISGFGGIDSMYGRHSAMRDAIDALGGIDAIKKRHDEMNLFASGSLAAKGTSFAASQSIELALRDIAGVSSFTGLLGRRGFDRTQFMALVSGTEGWRAASGSLSLIATLHAQLPDMVPERRRATASDFASAGLSRLGERFVRDSGQLARLQEEMLRIRRPWVDVGNPSQSVSAYVDARALATIVENGPPESRAVVTAVREELGDYRETDAVPEVVAANPVLRSAFRLEVGYNADLSSLPPAIIATVFDGFGGSVPRRIEADPDALESAVHQRARRLELKLRRFIEKKMMAKLGPKWSKQRVPGKTVAGWRARRQTDIDNGRTASRLFDYAGFEDYRAIIEQKDNWAEVFAPIFKVKTSILETLRRLSLIRNPDAHYRVVTIEDFLDLHTEGRRLDKWMDAAS